MPGSGPKGFSPVPILEDIAVVQHHIHSRDRVYPQDVTLTVQLAAAAVANTFGAWTLIIPLDTVPFPFMVQGIIIEQVSAASTYYIQIGYNIVNVAPGVNMELGERRVRLVTVPIARATELLHIQSQDVPENSSIWGRLKTASGIADTADISLVISRHVYVRYPVAVYPAFPW